MFKSFICYHCGNEFSTTRRANDKPLKYCSTECRNIGIAKHFIKEKPNCKYCNNKIKNKWGKIFCSSSCAASFNNKGITRNPKATGYSIQCHYCSINFYSRNKEQKYCSRACYWIFHKENFKPIIRNAIKANPEDIKCIHCLGKCKTTYNSFCSQKCNNEYNWKRKCELIISGKQVGDTTLKKYIMNISNKCSECNITGIYNHKPITLEMDHIDGDSSNNVLKNVRLLCPNCHSQTATYKAKNQHNPRGAFHRKKRYLRAVKNSPDIFSKLASVAGIEPTYSE